MSVIDIILIAIILLFAVLGAVTGFFKTMAYFGIYVGSAVLSKLLSAPIAAWIYHFFISNNLMETIKSHLPASLVNTDWQSAYQSVLEALPVNVSKIAEFLKLLPDESTVQSIGNTLSLESIEQNIIMPPVTKILTIVVGVALFLIVSVLLRLIVGFINKHVFEKKHSPLSATNRVLGFILGIVKGTIPAALLCGLMLLIIPLTKSDTLQTALTDSYICSFVMRLI